VGGGVVFDFENSTELEVITKSSTQEPLGQGRELWLRVNTGSLILDNL
jgi:hypothetical protein